jgi:hypothetical protein
MHAELQSTNRPNWHSLMRFSISPRPQWRQPSCRRQPDQVASEALGTLGHVQVTEIAVAIARVASAVALWVSSSGRLSSQAR